MLLDFFIFREGVHGIKYQGKHIHLFFQEQESNYVWTAEEITCCMIISQHFHWKTINQKFFNTVLKFTPTVQIQLCITKLSLKAAFYNSTDVLKFYHRKTVHTYLVKKVQNSTPIILYTSTNDKWLHGVKQRKNPVCHCSHAFRISSVF